MRTRYRRKFREVPAVLLFHLMEIQAGRRAISSNRLNIESVEPSELDRVPFS